MEIKIKYRTPSVNSVYLQNGWRRYMPLEYMALRDEIAYQTCLLAEKEIIRDVELKLTIRIHENWRNKGDGKIARKDLDDREKFLIDSVFAALPVDDRNVTHIDIKKVQDIEEYTTFKIEEAEELK